MAKGYTRTSAPAEVRAFAESVAGSAAQSITLLKAIELTIHWLVNLQDHARADAKFAAEFAEELKQCDRLMAIDPDGVLCAKLDGAEEVLVRLHAMLKAKHEAVHKANELCEAQREDIACEYDTAMDAIAHLHDAFVELRWAIGEHDADLEQPTGPAFSDPEELAAYLANL